MLCYPGVDDPQDPACLMEQGWAPLLGSGLRAQAEDSSQLAWAWEPMSAAKEKQVQQKRWT
jgi:hypothetical protein